MILDNSFGSMCINPDHEHTDTKYIRVAQIIINKVKHTLIFRSATPDETGAVKSGNGYVVFDPSCTPDPVRKAIPCSLPMCKRNLPDNAILEYVRRHFNDV